MTHKIALIGTGNMGSLHARVLAANERVELTRVIDPREDAGRAVADRYETQWTPEIGSLSDVDAVVLASATEAHYELAQEILGQGKPMLVEKPVCNSLEYSQEIVALSAKKDVPLMCGLLERYNPAVMTARALINEPIHLMARRHGPYAPRIKTGVAWDLLVHDVDLAIQFFGGSTPARVASGPATSTRSRSRAPRTPSRRCSRSRAGSPRFPRPAWDSARSVRSGCPNWTE